jgi:hypothetical protein
MLGKYIHTTRLSVEAKAVPGVYTDTKDFNSAKMSRT